MSQVPTRIFHARPAALDKAPLLVGMMGPPGSGKTKSALRLGTGMAEVNGGPLVVIDTERRAQKYAGEHRFEIVDFDPPFKPSDFLEAIRQQVKRGAGAVTVDSMSDEHEGEGGVLDWYQKDLDRLAGDDWQKRDRMNQLAWRDCKRDRLDMILGLVRITTPLIFCFRSREKTKYVPDRNGKMVPTNIGHQPIAPMEIVHALDLTCLLPARAEGVPVWSSDKIGEDYLVKQPSFLKRFIQEGRQLDEATGRSLAEWARGGSKPAAQADGAVPTAAADLIKAGDAAAELGKAELTRWWKALTDAQRKFLGAARRDDWAKIAKAADAVTEAEAAEAAA